MTTILLIIILTFINAFFAASEMAFVSLSPSTLYKLQQSKSKRSIYLGKVMQDATKYLSTIQVAITFAGFLSSAFAGSQLSTNLVAFLGNINIHISNTAALIIITFLLSYFTLVFGELVPKRLALHKSKTIALISAPIIFYTMKIFSPFIYILTLSTRTVVKLFGITPKKKNAQISEQEIKDLISFGQIKGLYNMQEKEMLDNIFSFDDRTVESIMTPVQDVIFIDADRINDKTIKTIIHSKYSRIPVYKNNTNNIIGVLHVKDLLEQMYLSNNTSDLLDSLRAPIIVSETDIINQVFKKMKQINFHFALVKEDNKLVGIITLEDILEEIVGDIYDEFDEKENTK
jgi:putative hemolysin